MSANRPPTAQRRSRSETLTGPGPASSASDQDASACTIPVAKVVYVPCTEPAGQERLFETGERPKPETLEDAVRGLFETARETANEYWIDETGGNAWIGLDRVCDAIDADMLTAHCLRVEE